MFELILRILLFYGLLIGCIILIVHNKARIKNLIDSIKARGDKKLIKALADESWDRAMKMKEMNEIEKENFKALGHIRVFLVNKILDDNFLKENVIPEFNRNAPVSEQLPINLTGKKLRKAIREKAEE